jgi:F0F1-type ATP synthase assembly protein I
MTSEREQDGGGRGSDDGDPAQASPESAAKLIKQQVTQRVAQQVTQRAERARPDTGLRRSMGRAYEAAFEAVFAVLIAIGLGYWADQEFGSSPIGIGLGAVLGFAAMVLRLVRLGHAMESEAAEAKKGSASEAKESKQDPE